MSKKTGKKKTNARPNFSTTRPAEEKPRKFMISPKSRFTFCGKKWHKIFIAVFLLLIILPTGSVFAFEKIFSDKIYPGVKIGDLNLGGKTKTEATALLAAATKSYGEEGVIFVYQNKKAGVLPIISAASDPDLSRTVFSFENEKTADAAMAVGRSENFWRDLKDQLKSLFGGKNLKLEYHLNEEEMIKVLKETFGYLEEPTRDAKLNIVVEEGSLTTNVDTERDGMVFNYASSITTSFQKLAELNKTPTPLSFIPEKAKIKKEETALAAERAKKLADLCFIALGESQKKWIIKQNEIRNLLEFQTDQNGVTVGLNKVETDEYLKNLAKEIDVPPQNAKLTVENGVVKEFQIHQGGKELNVQASYNKINDYLINFDETKISDFCPKTANPNDGEIIQLIVKITAPQIPIGSINNLGIQELVGRGASNFAGSPTNRRHNIAIGAAKLNGVLIAPGEEFSTNKALGEISGRTGYLPELVIKGDKTIPEYGGGLCQIGTTMFRVALDAGLPITERRPHSYRVVYYEPAGMDATIYGPKPDLKFVNDTPAYLLLQTKIDGDELTFDLWGTPDNRKVKISKPKIYNITSPGPTKIIETEDLAPGVKKCTERAHAGADAEFSRTITYKNGETKTETWASHYVPWSAVCLVGKEPTPPPTEPAPAESTTPPAISDPALNPLTF